MQALEQQIHELIDRTAIMEVLARYAITVDSGDADGFARLFTQDTVWEWPQTGLTYAGRDAVRGMAAAIARHLPGGQHVMSNHVIEVDGSHASAVCELTCFISRPQKIHTVLQGFYRDKLSKIDGRWYIAHRMVEVVNPEIISQGEIGELYSDLIRALSGENGS